MNATTQCKQSVLARDEARHYALLRSFVGCDAPLGTLWQALNSRPAVAGDGTQLWLVPSATVADQSYLIDLDSRACTCTGFRFKQSCSHLRAASLAARLRFHLTQPAQGVQP